MIKETVDSMRKTVIFESNMETNLQHTSLEDGNGVRNLTIISKQNGWTLNKGSRADCRA